MVHRLQDSSQHNYNRSISTAAAQQTNEHACKQYTPECFAEMPSIDAHPTELNQKTRPQTADSIGKATFDPSRIYNGNTTT